MQYYTQTTDREGELRRRHYRMKYGQLSLWPGLREMERFAMNSSIVTTMHLHSTRLLVGTCNNNSKPGVTSGQTGITYKMI